MSSCFGVLLLEKILADMEMRFYLTCQLLYEMVNVCPVKMEILKFMHLKLDSQSMV